MPKRVRITDQDTPVNSAALMLALPDEKPMLAEVGKALAAFNDVELHLSSVYFALVHPLPLVVAVLHYEELPNLSARIKIVEKLGALRLAEAAQAECRSIVKRAKVLKDRRNVIAHFRAEPWHPSGQISRETANELEVRLRPGLTRFLPGRDPLESLTLTDVVRFQKDCLNFAGLLIQFADKLERFAQQARTDSIVFAG